jgi:HEPN domain-containing protein
MKDETKTWLQYADENFESAKMLLDGGLFNPCLQNIQQSIEKLLKALLVEFSLKFMKTHSVNPTSCFFIDLGPKADYFPVLARVISMGYTA